MRAIVYDLTSENRTALEGTTYYNRLKTLRIKSTKRLHRLGVQCTESVILVNGNNGHRVQDVIDRILSEYEYLLAEIKVNLSVNLPTPIIKVLDITGEQYDAFKELAKRRLQELLDIHIDRVSSILERQKATNAERLIRSLRKLRKEWIRIRAICRDMGIDLDHDIDYLLQLIHESIRHIRGGTI